MCLFIYWELFKNDKKLNDFNNEANPYESAVKIILRGGFISYKELFYNVSGIDIRKNEKTLNFVLPSIENDFLDYIDSKCKLMGSDGIPNQERVNELWEEFQNVKQ